MVDGSDKLAVVVVVVVVADGCSITKIPYSN